MRVNPSRIALVTHIIDVSRLSRSALTSESDNLKLSADGRRSSSSRIHQGVILVCLFVGPHLDMGSRANSQLVHCVIRGVMQADTLTGAHKSASSLW